MAKLNKQVLDLIITMNEFMDEIEPNNCTQEEIIRSNIDAYVSFCEHDFSGIDWIYDWIADTALTIDDRKENGLSTENLENNLSTASEIIHMMNGILVS